MIRDSSYLSRLKTSLVAIAGTACIAASFLDIAIAQTTTPPSGAVPKRFFLSGHSLTDNPFPDYIAALGKSRGSNIDWNQQIMLGASILARTQGMKERGPWNGYRLGKNRTGSNLDILEEFKRKSGQLYDTLIITEAHKLVSQFVWGDSVRHLRHYHERIIEHNPAARTFFLEPWEGVNDKADMAPWIALERDGSKLWRCAADRINLSLAHEGRPDRISTIPVGAALAELLEAMGKGAVPALGPAGSKTAIDSVLKDTVHLGPNGNYFAAVLTYATITEQPIEGIWRPGNVPDAAALALQRFAWNFHQQRKKSFKPLDMAGCRRLLQTSYCDAWNAYVPNQWSGPMPSCKEHFSRETMALGRNHAPNPFVFSPSEDAKYWLPAP